MDQEWMAIIIIMNIGLLNAVAVMCPKGCSCQAGNGSVACNSLKTDTLQGMLSSLSADTRELVLHAAHFSSFETNQHKKTSTVLEILRLQHSNLHCLNTGTFSSVPTLRELYLDHNALQKIDEGSFVVLHQLLVLNLAHNHLSHIRSSTFRNLRKLQVLKLDHNSMVTLESGVFDGLFSLSHLDLSYNMLDVLNKAAFKDASNIEVLNVESNNLQVLLPTLWEKMHSLSSIHLHNNPWDCTCVLHWLHQALQIRGASLSFPGNYSIICATPTHLHLKPLYSIDTSELECTSPAFDEVADDQSFQYLHDYMVHCSAAGSPPPSVYWPLRPGIVAHPEQISFIPFEEEIHSKLTYSGQPTHYEATVTALSNGSLHFHQFRSVYIGEYTCIAQSPGGVVNVTVQIGMNSAMGTYELYSVFFGMFTAGTFLFVSLIFASLRFCIVHLYYKKRFKHLPSGITIEISDEDERKLAQSSPFLFRFNYSDDADDTPPDYSPVKCVTPADTGDAEHDFSEMSSRILETLEDVRSTLRYGMGRQVDRIRSRAHYVRESSSRYVQSIRASGSSYMHTLRESSSKKLCSIRETGSRRVRSIRDSSSQYASRVRAGVTLGVVQVKYHVQSIKEMCGTGEMTHTISTVSVATDVDSRERFEVVRTVTYV